MQISQCSWGLQCACMRVWKEKCAALAPPEDSYGLLPVLRAAEREGLSHISRSLPAETATVPLPQHSRQRAEATTCSQRALKPYSTKPAPARSKIYLNKVSTSTHKASPIGVAPVWLLQHGEAPSLRLRGRGSCLAQTEMRPAFFGPTLPAANTKPRRHGGGSARLSVCLVGQRDPVEASVIVDAFVGSKCLCPGIELRVRLLCSVIYRRNSFMESSPRSAARAKQSDTRATCFCNFVAAWTCTALSARLKLGLGIRDIV